MRILHVIPSTSLTQGGPSFALPMFVEGLAQRGVEVDVASTDDDGPGKRLDRSTGVPVPQNGGRYFFFRKQAEFYKPSLPLQRWLHEHVANYDVVHVHALFSFASVVAGRAARRRDVPYVIRPLGVLNRWGVENRRALLKRMSLKILELPLLKQAAALQFTSEAERDEAMEIDPGLSKIPAFVIPLPIAQHATGSREEFLSRFPELRNRQIVLFLSRIDPKKGIEFLLEAFATVRRRIPETALVLAGDGPAGYSIELRNRVKELGLTDCVVWAGHLEGLTKGNAFASASCFVLPSMSENFGIAAAEALSAGVPTVVSEEVAISHDVRSFEGGVVVRRDPDEIADAVCGLLQDRAQAERLALNGRRLVAERYSPEGVARSLVDMYSRVVGARAVSNSSQ